MSEAESTSGSATGNERASVADVRHMRRALELARKGWGGTHPNPMVGAVIVEDGVVTAEAFHERDGGSHAERAALAALKKAPGPGATLYVTLEPCSTRGRTGACCEAIAAAGIRRVVVGATDPNPDHAGKGYEVLRRVGIEVVTGVLESQCSDLNLIFNHWIQRGTPLIAGKVALTLDGRIATRTGESQWITGPAARADAHRLRRLFPSIAVGAATALADNPRLTARMDGEPESCPVRFVFDGRLRTIAGGSLPALYTDEFRSRTIVVTTQHGGMGYVRKLKELGVDVWVCEAPAARVPFAEFRKRCVAARISGVFVEGGSNLMSQLLLDRQMDYLFAYRAPVLLADERAKGVLAGLRTEKLASAVRLSEVRHEILGEDVLTHGRMVYPEKLPIDESFLASGNAHKVGEFRALAGGVRTADGTALEILSAAEAGGLPAVVEDTGTFRGNAFKKAHALAGRVPPGAWALADDSGLCVDALDGAPGVESAYFAGPQGDAAANLSRLVEVLRGVPEERRGAHFVCVLALVRPGGGEWVFEGRCNGRLLAAPRGGAGFGYDPLFVPEGYGQSFSELAGEVKNRIGHRGRAWAELVRWLATR